jgi:hypothetical protein
VIVVATALHLLHHLWLHVQRMLRVFGDEDPPYGHGEVQLRGVRLPVGDVLVIATWNYPLQLLGIQLAQSVIAGNRTTVKPSERAPSSQRLLVELAIEALGDTGLDASSIGLEDASRDQAGGSWRPAASTTWCSPARPRWGARSPRSARAPSRRPRSN